MSHGAARLPADLGLWGGRRLLPARSPFGVACVAFLALYTVAATVPGTHRLLGGLAYHLPPLVALAFAPAVILRTRGRERAGWLCIAALLVAWDGAEWVYSYHSLVRDNEAPIPSPADWLYYAGYAAFIAALGLMASTGRRLRDPRAMVDAAIVVTVSGVLWWHFLLKPLLPDSGASVADFVLFGYPLLDMGLAAALAVAFYGSAQNYSPPVRWILGSVVLLLATDTIYTLTAGESVAQASLLDVGWLASYLCLAAAMKARLSAAEVESRERGGAESWLGMVLPYVALAPLLATAAYERFHGNPGGYVAGGTAITAILILARQWLTLLDNRRLYGALETKAAELAEQARTLEELRRRAAHQASHDDLTGLLNRRAWFAAARQQGGGVIALFDIDRFKSINDRLGHPFGDRVLRGVAKRMSELVAGQGVVGRVGGEEFAVLFRCEAAFAERICQRVVREFAAHPTPLGPEEEFAVTMSAGVARWQRGADLEAGVTATYEHADRALYMAKHTGRNRVVCDDQLAA